MKLRLRFETKMILIAIGLIVPWCISVQMLSNSLSKIIRHQSEIGKYIGEVKNGIKEVEQK
jgi:hypothetical protein